LACPCLRFQELCRGEAEIGGAEEGLQALHVPPGGLLLALGGRHGGAHRVHPWLTSEEPIVPAQTPNRCERSCAVGCQCGAGPRVRCARDIMSFPEG